MTLAFASSTIDFDARTTGRGPFAALGRVMASLAQRFGSFTTSRGVARRETGSAATIDRTKPLSGGARNITMAARPLNQAEQWQRCVRALDEAAASAQSMTDLHDAAGKQLLSVDYALEQLIGDLSAVMTVPRTPRASVHVLHPVEPVRFTDVAKAPAPRAKPSIAA